MKTKLKSNTIVVIFKQLTNYKSRWLLVDTLKFHDQSTTKILPLKKTKLTLTDWKKVTLFKMLLHLIICHNTLSHISCRNSNFFQDHPSNLLDTWSLPRGRMNVWGLHPRMCYSLTTTSCGKTKRELTFYSKIFD